MAEHAKLPPSSAHIWGAPDGCRAWPQMMEKYPDTRPPSPEAEEGNVAHEIARTAIDAGLHALPSDIKINTQTTNGAIITEEMCDAVKIYVDLVLGKARKYGIFGGEHIGIEQQIEIPNIHKSVFGTPDAWVYSRRNAVLDIFDFKYGHTYVDVFENWQLICYTAGLFHKLGINGVVDQYTTVNFYIVQPRSYQAAGPVRTWSVDAHRLRPYFNILEAAANETLSGGAQLRTGPHCKHCSARLNCQAALASGMALYEISMELQNVDLSPYDLGIQLSIVERAIQQLDALKTAYSAEAEVLIRSGKIVPGWVLGSTSPRERWIKPVEEVIQLGRMFNVDISKPDVDTPNQARKKGVPAEIVAGYSERPKGTAKLIQEKASSIKKVFGP